MNPSELLWIIALVAIVMLALGMLLGVHLAAFTLRRRLAAAKDSLFFRGFVAGRRDERRAQL